MYPAECTIIKTSVISIWFYVFGVTIFLSLGIFEHFVKSPEIIYWDRLDVCYALNDVILSAMASHITQPHDFYSTVYSSANQRKHQSSASLAFVRGIHRWPVNSPHKGPVTRNMFPFDDVIMVGVVMVDSNLNNEIPAMVKLPGQYGVISAILWSYGIILPVCVLFEYCWVLPSLLQGDFIIMMTSSNGNIFRVSGPFAVNSPLKRFWTKIYHCLRTPEEKYIHG